MNTTYHDITTGKGKYILEWRHGGLDNDNYIMITEACDDPEDEEDSHMHETYDFQEVI